MKGIYLNKGEQRNFHIAASIPAFLLFCRCVSVPEITPVFLGTFPILLKTNSFSTNVEGKGIRM